MLASPRATRCTFLQGVVAPIDHGFPEVALLRHPRGRMFLNFIRRAFDEFPIA